MQNASLLAGPHYRSTSQSSSISQSPLTPCEHRVPALNHLQSLHNDLLAVTLHVFVCRVPQIAVIFVVIISMQIQGKAAMALTAVTTRVVVTHARTMRWSAVRSRYILTRPGHIADRRGRNGAVAVVDTPSVKR